MPTKRFAIEVGAPKRLLVSWGFRWKEFVVKLDDVEVGRIDGGFDAVREGRTFDLPSGSKLRVQLVLEPTMMGKVPQLHLYFDGKPVPGSEAVPLPSWSYVFIVGCALIPVVTLGGAVPAAIGVGGAAGCASIARDPSRAIAVRAALCASVTVGCWAGLALFLWVVARP